MFIYICVNIDFRHTRFYNTNLFIDVAGFRLDQSSLFHLYQNRKSNQPFAGSPRGPGSVPMWREPTNAPYQTFMLERAPSEHMSQVEAFPEAASEPNVLGEVEEEAWTWTEVLTKKLMIVMFERQEPAPAPARQKRPAVCPVVKVASPRCFFHYCLNLSVSSAQPCIDMGADASPPPRGGPRTLPLFGEGARNAMGHWVAIFGSCFWWELDTMQSFPRQKKHNLQVRPLEESLSC